MTLESSLWLQLESRLKEPQLEAVPVVWEEEDESLTEGGDLEDVEKWVNMEDGNWWNEQDLVTHISGLNT